MQPLTRKARAFSSVGLEHLPYKQRVGGSNPSTPTLKGSFQSGQMGQTVNLLLLASVVRIHHYPQQKRKHLHIGGAFFMPIRKIIIITPEFIIRKLKNVITNSGSVLKPSCKPILLSIQFHKYLLPLHHEESPIITLHLSRCTCRLL